MSRVLAAAAVLLGVAGATAGKAPAARAPASSSPAATAHAPATRATAQAAIDDARGAVETCSDDDLKRKATGLLLKAKAAFDDSRFADAQSLAIEARGIADSATTRISVIVDPENGETRFVVQHGAVEVSAAGQTAVAHPGELVRTGSGGAPRVIESHLAAPTPVEPEEGGTLRAADGRLRWSRVTGASRYSLTVARDAAFRDRVATVETEGVSATLGPGLAEGTYRWRVIAVGDDGSESAASSTRRFRIDNTPPTPVASGQVRLYWLRDHHCESDASCAPWVAVDTETGVEREVNEIDLHPLALDAAHEAKTRGMLVNGQLAVRGAFHDGGKKTVLQVVEVRGRR